MSSISRTKNVNRFHATGAGSAIQERDEILELIKQKSANNTLTLEESNILYERFNQALEVIADKKKQVEEVDESWALELIRECEAEEAAGA